MDILENYYKERSRDLRIKCLLTLKRVNKLIILGNYSRASELSERANRFEIELNNIRTQTKKAA